MKEHQQRDPEQHEPREEWNTAELQEQYTVKGFGTSLCVVERKSDGVLGSLNFDHHPRIYYDFVAH